MTRNKEVTKSLESCRNNIQNSLNKKKRVRSQVAEISQRKREIATGLMVDNLVAQQEQSRPVIGNN